MPSERLRVFAVELEEGGSTVPVALMAGFTSRLYNRYGGARVLRFHQPDGAPLLPRAAAGCPVDEVIASVLAHGCAMRPANDTVRIGPMPYPSSRFQRTVSTLRDAGFLTQRYLVFQNRYEGTAGMSSAQYLARRSSRLRNTITRRTRAFERTGNGRFELVTSAERLPAVLEDYDRVFSSSWKLGEHVVSVDYIHAIMACAARAGALRLGLLYAGDEPVAAQFWLLRNGSAMCYRLAYVQLHARMSPGTVLTWLMLQHLLDEDHVSELDFGIGDDDYKKEWMGELRELWGIDAFNPRTIRGLRCAARHFLPPLIKPVLRPLWRRLRPWLQRV